MDWERQQKILGQNVRVKRKSLKLSQEKLALNTYIDRSYLRRIEDGCANPSVRIIRKLATKLKTSVRELITSV